MEFFNPTLTFTIAGYFYELVQYFVDRGYERGKSIRAAPYDWRLAPGMLEQTGVRINHLLMCL